MKSDSCYLVTLLILLILGAICSCECFEGSFLKAKADSVTLLWQTGLKRYDGLTNNNSATYVVNLHDNTLSVISGQIRTVAGNLTFINNTVAKIAIGLHYLKSPNLISMHEVGKSGLLSSKGHSSPTSGFPTPIISSKLSSKSLTKQPYHPPLVP
jgi:hypothetical protein